MPSLRQFIEQKVCTRGVMRGEEKRKLVVPRSNLQLGNILEVVWVDPRTYFRVAKMEAGDVAQLVKSLSGLHRALGSSQHLTCWTAGVLV